MPRINYDVLTCYLHILYKNNLLLPVIKGVLQSLYRHYQLQKIGTDGMVANGITYTIVVHLTCLAVVLLTALVVHVLLTQDTVVYSY